ncbi:MAG: DegV family protein [Actinomycetota bacterium]
MSVRIATDSTCDLPPEVIAEHRIAAVPLHIKFGTQSDLDGAVLARAAFYARLAGRRRPGV